MTKKVWKTVIETRGKAVYVPSASGNLVNS
jgi:hypothetical protein